MYFKKNNKRVLNDGKVWAYMSGVMYKLYTSLKTGTEEISIIDTSLLNIEKCEK